LLTEDQRRAIVDAALAAQQADGGWTMASLGAYKRADGTALDTVSDGLATGLLAAVLSETAIQLETSSGRTTIELGARGALGVRMGASRFAPFAALHAELIPSPPEIYALPAGVAGHTPWFWIGASAGASLGFL